MKYCRFEIIKYLVCIQFVYLMECIFILQFVTGRDNLVSVADYLMLTSSGKFFGLVEMPLIIMVMCLVNKDDWNVIYVLKNNSLKKVFHIQCIRGACLAVFMVIYRTVSIITWILLSGKSLINWYDTNSYYADKFKITSDIRFSDFIWRYMLEIFVLILTLIIIALVLEWMFGKLAAFIVIIAVALVESGNFINGNNKLIYGRLISSPAEIINISSIYKHIVLGSVLIVLLCVSGRIIIKRKEFIK